MPYITEYTPLTQQEQRQLTFKRRYKQETPAWDDSMVLLTTLVRQRLCGGESVIDFGCGRGNFVIDELRDLFSSVQGFDVSAEATRGNTTCQHIQIGGGEGLPFAAESANVVLSLWVFEHLAKPAEVLAEIYRVLVPGGFVAFVTPNKHSLLISLRRILSDNTARRLLKMFYGREEEDAFPVYYRANTVSGIVSLAREAGFIPEVVQENVDPSYTSFGVMSYFLSRIFSRFGGSLARPHLVVVLRKLGAIEKSC